MKTTTRLDIESAEQFGRMAFARGAKRVPVLDKAFFNEVLAPNTAGKPIGSSDGAALCEAWTRGFNSEAKNLESKTRT